MQFNASRNKNENINNESNYLTTNNDHFDEPTNKFQDKSASNAKIKFDNDTSCKNQITNEIKKHQIDRIERGRTVAPPTQQC